MKNTANHKVIILEGCDRSGKDSMQLAIDSVTKYRHMCIDRGPVGFSAYKELLNKPDEKANFEELERIEEGLLNVPHLMIYIHCDPEELKRRCDVTNHEYYDFEKHLEVYKKWFDKSRLNKVIVDSTNKHVTDIAKELANLGLI